MVQIDTGGEGVVLWARVPRLFIEGSEAHRTADAG